MKRKIVYEGDNLALSAGTGIATYARTLGKTARGLGYSTDVLIGTHSFLDRDDKILNQIALDDALNVHKRRLSHSLWLKTQEITGSPFGIRPVAIRRETPVRTSAVDQFAGFEVIHASPSLIDQARHHFLRWKKLLKVNLETPNDLFHATQATPMAVAGCPNIYTLHDIVPLRAPQTTLENKRFFLDMVRELCKRADHIVTVSEFSRSDIIDLIGIEPDRITNTYQAVEFPPEMLARSEDAVANDLDNFYRLEPGGYFLFIGAIEPKKNLSRLIEAYASSGAKRPLIIAGGLGWQYKTVLSQIRDERFIRYVVEDGEIAIKRRVRRLDYVPLSRLVTLLKGARAVLFPSIYEGFGLPVAEAMSAGAPVMTSNSTSLAEIAGDAALLVNPYDIDKMADAIRSLDNDDALRADLRQRGIERAKLFSAANYQTRIGTLYDRILR